jgi:hypothetical protein
MLALAVMESGTDKLCTSCAMKNAKESGFPHLYFGVQKVTRVNGDDTCLLCGKEYGSQENIQAAEKILNLLKS